MTDSYQPGQEGIPAAAEPQIQIGAELRAARERAGLSVIDVAQRLKFAARQIEALEADNFAALPGLTFVRGFLRSYAKLLGLDADRLVSALERAAARDAGPSTVQLQSLTATTAKPFPMRQANTGSAWPWVVGMIVAVVGIGGFILYQWQAPSTVSQPETANVPVASPNIAPVATPDAPASAGAEASAVSAPQAAASAGNAVSLAAASELAKPPVVQAPPAAAAAPAAALPAAVPAQADAAGNGKIHLVFSEESWTEIRAAGGQVVYSKNNLPGSDAWVDGTPPFDFVIGNAKGVKLYYRGSEVDLAPYIKVSVARMQLK